MREGWGERELDLPRTRSPTAPRAPPRPLADAFPGERLVVPAGQFKVRANDTDYRFRADTAHVHLTGNQTSDAVLVVEDGESVLYARPALLPPDRRVLPRPPVRRAVGRPPPVAEGDLRLARPRGAPPRRARGPPRQRRPRPACSATSTRTSTGRSPATAPATTTSPGCCRRCGWSRTPGSSSSSRRPATSPRSASPTASASGTDVLEYGERWLEGTFFRRARTMGNDLGYDSIVAGGSTPPPCTGPRTAARSRPASCCCSTWAWRATTSTPPT